jgi:hypothetical protein
MHPRTSENSLKTPFAYPSPEEFNTNKRYLFLTSFFASNGGLPLDRMDALFEGLLTDRSQKVQKLLPHFFFRESYSHSDFWTSARFDRLFSLAPYSVLHDAIQFFATSQSVQIRSSHLLSFLQKHGPLAVEEARLAVRAKSTKMRYDFSSLERTSLVWRHPAIRFLLPNDLLMAAQNEIGVALALPTRFPFALREMVDAFDQHHLWNPDLQSLFVDLKRTHPESLANGLFLRSDASKPWTVEDVSISIQTHQPAFQHYSFREDFLECATVSLEQLHRMSRLIEATTWMPSSEKDMILSVLENRALNDSCALDVSPPQGRRSAL